LERGGNFASDLVALAAMTGRGQGWLIRLTMSNAGCFARCGKRQINA